MSRTKSMTELSVCRGTYYQARINRLCNYWVPLNNFFVLQLRSLHGNIQARYHSLLYTEQRPAGAQARNHKLAERESFIATSEL